MILSSTDLELMQVPAAEQVRSLVRALFEPDDVVEIRYMDDTKPKGEDAISRWYTAWDLAGAVRNMRRMNERGYNVHFGINPRKAKGMRGDVGVKLARCLFVDLDPLPGGAISIEGKLEQVARLELPDPSAVVASGHGYWCFWRLAEALEIAAWKAVLVRLIAALDGDELCKNAERLARVPGFLNHKEPKALAWLWMVRT